MEAEYKLFHYQPFINSINDGITAGIAELRTVSRLCPNAKLVLAGYSQGAMVWHKALVRLAANNDPLLSKIAATALIADGDKVKATAAQTYGSSSSQTAQGVRTALTIGASDIPSSKAASTYDICNSGDLVCNFDLLAYLHQANVKKAFGDAVRVHTTSYKSSAMVAGVAQLMAARLFGAVSQPPPGSGWNTSAGRRSYGQVYVTSVGQTVVTDGAGFTDTPAALGYDAGGNLLWSIPVGVSHYVYSNGGNVTSDADGNIYLAVSTDTDVARSDDPIIQEVWSYSPAGQLRWKVDIGAGVTAPASVAIVRLKVLDGRLMARVMYSNYLGYNPQVWVDSYDLATGSRTSRLRLADGSSSAMDCFGDFLPLSGQGTAWLTDFCGDNPGAGMAREYGPDGVLTVATLLPGGFGMPVVTSAGNVYGVKAQTDYWCLRQPQVGRFNETSTVWLTDLPFDGSLCNVNLTVVALPDDHVLVQANARDQPSRLFVLDSLGKILWEGFASRAPAGSYIVASLPAVVDGAGHVITVESEVQSCARGNCAVMAYDVFDGTSGLGLGHQIVADFQPISCAAAFGALNCSGSTVALTGAVSATVLSISAPVIAGPPTDAGTRS